MGPLLLTEAEGYGGLVQQSFLRHFSLCQCLIKWADAGVFASNLSSSLLIKKPGSLSLSEVVVWWLFMLFVELIIHSSVLCWVLWSEHY